jgi:hypothetical protein
MAMEVVLSIPPALAHLQRIIPVMETRELSRGQVTCVALEIYDDGAWLNSWIRFQGIDEHSPEQWPFLEVAAIDDLGNRYTGWLGGAYGGSSTPGDCTLRFHHPLSPAIAPDARALKLQVRVRETGRGPLSRSEPIVWNHDLEQIDPAADHTILEILLT